MPALKRHTHTHLYAHTDNSRVSCIHANVFAIAAKQMTLCRVIIIVIAASGIAVLFSVLVCLLNSSVSLFLSTRFRWVCAAVEVLWSYCSVFWLLLILYSCSVHFEAVTYHLCLCLFFVACVNACVRTFVLFMYVRLWFVTFDCVSVYSKLILL